MDKNKKVNRDSGTILSRELIVFGVISFAFFLLFFMMIYRMVIKSSDYKTRALDQWSNEVKIDAKRGNILDRNGQQLAVSVDVYRIDVDLGSLRKYSKANEIPMDEIAKKLSDGLSIDKKDLLKLLSKQVQAVTIARRIEKQEADAIIRLEYRGVIVSPDTERYYVNGDFLSQTIGVTNSDGIGQTGIELQYNKVLSGIPGIRTTEVDAYNNDLPYVISDFTKPIPGKDVGLTIDQNIQFFAESEAEEALSDNKAKAVTIMVMDPNTGEILALANKNSFDLNNPRVSGLTSAELSALWTNRAVSRAYEPGSIFKVFTLAAALEEKVVKESDTFNCTGSTKVMGITLHCWLRTGHGVQTLKEILENSCNIGFIDVGERLGIKKLHSYVLKYGFGQKTGIDLPGESAGIVKPENKMTQLDLATMSFGQVNSVTNVQYMKAFNAVANGGKFITPHVMKEISHTDSNGERVIDNTYQQYYPNNKVSTVISPEVSKEIRNDLESVISEGGGSKAFIKGYRIAGKTGTAQKLNEAGTGYGAGMYVSTFVGMAPADKPQYTVMVQIDEPHGEQYYAGQIAAPVGKEVFGSIFNYYSINTDTSSDDVDPSMKKDVIVPNVVGMKKENAQKLLQENLLNFDIDGSEETIRDMSPKPGVMVKEGTKITLYTDSTVNINKDVVVPDLSGYTKDTTNQILTNLGLKVTFEGDGLVSSQGIAPNTKVLEGESIKVSLTNVTD